ncbi:hypothetical protein P879_10927 [Paragonimus westermani]|uniref:Uncharacterized protein n=1 Tax=Paragonimus westermani TaxID=34504 RepID=A0A8T0DE44_9TREM|nr:hypothetical protein P879_10927 [Paragonimus westermani]
MALRVHDRQTLIGPPETPRDYVLAAAKAMRYGNWSACTQYIINPKMDAKASLEVPSDFLIMHKTERSRLQTLALQLSEKISTVVVVVVAVSSALRVLNRIKADEPSRYQARLFGFEVRRQGLRYGLNKFN